jgi:LysM repeat protein
VHADPVAELLRSYGLDAHADTDLGWDEVRAEVAEGRPVIVWVIGSIWAGDSREYQTNDGENVTVANNEHTMIVIGYDANRVHLVDALTGYTITHTIENFLASWSVLDNMAIIGEGSGELPASEVDSEVSGETYIVQPGDTLNKVASRFDLYWPDLAALNDIAYPYILYPGQVLQLGGEVAQVEEPEVEDEESIYTVQPDDDLMSIARDLGLDWVTLARFNEIEPPFVVSPGLALNIPQDGEDPEIAVPDTFTATATVSLVDLGDYFGLDWIELAARNGIAFPYLLSPGQTIALK